METATTPDRPARSAERNVPLGNALVAQGILSPERLTQALEEQKRTGRVLGRILVENGYATEEQIARTLAHQLEVPYVDLKRFEVDFGVVRMLNELQSRRYRAIVLEDREETYLVGFVDPSDLRSQDEISSLVRRPLDIGIVTNDLLGQTLDRVFRKTEQIGEYAKEVERAVEIDRESDLQIIDLATLDESLEEAEAPVVRLLQSVFDDAVQVRASDIHFQPQEKSLEVRFRIDGVVHNQVSADAKIAAPLVVRLKLMAGLDIGEKRLPQDGRIAIRAGSRRVDVRVSVMPSQYGESVVLRLLMAQGELVDLKDTGMPPKMYESFLRVLSAPHGVILVTGPTGSGKTTTLYGALQRLNEPSVKILTCEDPVEYRIPGLVQVQINEKIELTFARVLRSFLRHDPDILLVGEIRDEETAEIAARAAMTGHLVLSTVHTNDTISTPSRLRDMKVPAYMLASTLLAIIAQRLVRLNCRYCAEPYTPTPTEMAWVGHFASGPLDAVKFMHGKGCPRCNHSGYTGRKGVFEMIEMNSALAAAVHADEPAKFQAAARAQLGLNTIGHCALDLVLAGETTVSEAMQVVTAGEG